MASSDFPVCARSIDRGLAVGLIGNLAWTTWHLGGAMAGPMAWSFTVMMGLLGVVILRRSWWSAPTLPTGWWWPLPFLVYVAIQVGFWGATPGRGWLDALNWGWIAAGYWVSLHVMKQPTARPIVWSGVAAVTLGLVVLAGYQRLVDPSWLPMGRIQVPQFLERSGGAFGAPASLAGWMMMILPLAGVVFMGKAGQAWWKRGAGGLLVVGGCLALLWTYSRGGWLALTGALMVWPLMHSRRSLGARLRAVVVVAILLGLVGSVVYLTVPTAKERLNRLYEQSGEITRPILWRAAWGNMKSNPWWGTGGGSFEVMLERHRPIRFWDETRWTHNDYLNTLSDYGIVGFILSFGAMATVVMVQLRRRKLRESQGDEGASQDPTWSQALMVGGIALGAGLLIDFHLKVPAVSLLASILGADWMNQTDRRNTSISLSQGIENGNFGRSCGLLGAVGVVVFGMLEAAPKFQAEGLRFIAREKIDRAATIKDSSELRTRILPTLAPLERASQLFPGSEEIWSDLAYSQVLRVHWDGESAGRFGIEAEDSARRGLKLCDQDWQNWVRLGTALDLQGRWGEAGLAFGQAVKIASNSTNAWYYQAFHLSLKPAARPVAEAALATCLRLDPWNPDGEALRASFERDRK